jgi:hypothetical protein
MGFDAHANLAFSKVVTPPSPATSGTSLVVTTGEGTLFPAAPFNAIVYPFGQQPTQANSEIVRVTVVSTDTFTIVRNQEGGSVRSILAGFVIAAGLTKKTLTDIETATTAVTDSAVFNTDGTISETINGVTATTTSNADGSISTVFGAPISKTRTTVFNTDGSITETLT